MHIWHKKLKPTSSTAAEEVVNETSTRLFVYDNKTKKSFLIDTGADVSLIAAKQKNSNTNNKNERILYAANGSMIKTFGEIEITLALGLRRNFTWPFIIADVNTSIIGADFLNHFGLIVDIKMKRLIDTSTKIFSAASERKVNAQKISTVNTSCKIADLLKEYIDITKPTPTNRQVTKVTHHILTKGPPICERPRRLPPDKLAAAKRRIPKLSHSRNMPSIKQQLG
ncbi:uncharacterized protein LOC119663316 [Teleopsis dalmanni]|uniref:uncharacterized protein LOC119663316 n=1 Tax=Teleopsis dalmanni TaxID=139649 RepID=UPI0018CE2BC5|nr:uncharacterized protein LOC119663316 [Teleopsis dalmanni]